MTDICDVYKLWKSLEVFLESQVKQNSRPSTLFIPDTFLINPFPEECENEFVLFITSLFFCFVFLESLFSTFPGIINRIVNWLIDQFNVQSMYSALTWQHKIFGLLKGIVIFTLCTANGVIECETHILYLADRAR